MIKRISLFYVLGYITLLFSSVSVYAQDKKKAKKEELPTSAVALPKPELPKTTLKPYKEIITDKAKTTIGLFTVHKVEDKYYFEVVDSLMGRELMAITRISKTAAITGTYGGELLNRQVIRFEKGPENKLFIRAVQYINIAPDSAAPIFKAVRNSNIDPIAQSFDIKAIRKDSLSKAGSVVIDVTDFFKGDNQIVSIQPNAKSNYKMGGVLSDRTYIQSIKTFPINTEIKVVKTYSASGSSPSIMGLPNPFPSVSIPAANATGAVTMEFNTSIIMLPQVPMKKRLYDARIGFFANGYTIFDEGSQRTEDQTFAVRWRLEPKNEEDAKKQKAGQLIEPAKPIVFYIDPATPAKWRNYLKLGVDDWQKAFEAAGWKNAIRGEIVAENDTTISLEDARFSAIRYFASTIENAYGPNVHDPRSGEILESHIGWYHNVMKLLKKWYTTQAGAVDPRARKNKFDDELMGDLVRFVASHEVGHTLGLRHNFGSSSTVPVEKLRDPKWIAEHGHTPSIMDYARFNYVAQPEDRVKDLYPHIGEYDIWAIKWGYQTLDGITPDEDAKILNKQYLTEIKKNPRVWFGTESNYYDPRSQSECLGDNNMLASDYGIKNLKRIVPNLPEWTKEEAQDYDLLAEAYSEIIGQYRRYIGHVVKNIGGTYETPRTMDEEGNVYEQTPKAIQKDAQAWLQRQVFDTPTWLLDAKITNQIRPDQGLESIGRIQEFAFIAVLSSDRLQRMLEMSAVNPNAYSVDELEGDLRAGIFSELKTRKAPDAYRRNLQKILVDKYSSMLSPLSDSKRTDIYSITRGQLTSLRDELKLNLSFVSDKMTKYHYQDLVNRITLTLDPK